MEKSEEKFHYGKKEYWTNTGKNMQEKAGYQSNNITSCYPPLYQIQLTLVISTSVISNNRLSQRENLILV